MLGFEILSDVLGAVMQTKVPEQKAGRQSALGGVINSLTGFAVAPPLERRCLYAVAMRTTPEDCEEFRPAFLHADVDGDGKISRQDFAEAIKSEQSAMAVDALFRAADMDCSGALTFVEFVAACLYSRLAPLDHWLAEQTFHSLDCDRDGLVNVDEARTVFGQDLPKGLPRSRSFALAEWIACVIDGLQLNLDHRYPKTQAQVSESADSLDGDFAGILDRCCTRKIKSTRSGCWGSRDQRSGASMNEHSEWGSAGDDAILPQTYQVHYLTPETKVYQRMGLDEVDRLAASAGLSSEPYCPQRRV
jgi:Ca2+-binding EF-hand superfamily protein